MHTSEFSATRTRPATISHHMQRRRLCAIFLHPSNAFRRIGKRHNRIVGFTLPDARMPPSNAAIFAGYTIIRLPGCGGKGEVYPAQPPRLPRCDALNVLPEDMTANREYPGEFDAGSRSVNPSWAW
jgi:hypothetical protein